MPNTVRAFEEHLLQDADCNTDTVATGVAQHLDDLSREVFGVLGMPIDALGLPASLRALDVAVERRKPFLLSTPNVNFLISCQAEPEFREALLKSDLCPADGMPIVWIARLLGVPIRDRVSGADLFDALKLADRVDRPLRVFLFGGADGIAAQVGRALNLRSRGLKCVGTLNPGFGTVDEMSDEQIIRTINLSGADILIVSLSAKKAQAWLLQNHDRFQIPVRAQFGATINFEAQTVKRAPRFVRQLGFEWLWRIKEEPYLWRRYWTDGKKLLRLLLTCALPAALISAWLRSLGAWAGEGQRIELREHPDSVVVTLSGLAISQHIDEAVDCFRDALDRKKALVVNVSGARVLDPRFFGLLLMVRKRLRAKGQTLRFVGVTPSINRLFRLNGFEFLLSPEKVETAVHAAVVAAPSEVVGA